MVRRRVEGRGGGGEAASAAAIGRVGAAVDQVRLHVEGQEAGAGLEGREEGQEIPSSLEIEYSPVGFKNQIWRLANIFEHLLTRVHLPLQQSNKF